MRVLREELEAVGNEIQIAEREYDLNKAAELKYGRLPAIKKQLEEEENRVKLEGHTLVHESVSEGALPR